MRIYSASREETLRARRFLKDWAGEGYLTQAQYETLEKEAVSDLRNPNFFLRLVLLLFTLLSVSAAVALFLEVFLSHPKDQTVGVFLMIFAVVSYAAAEVVVSRSRLYRYGIEEGLAVCSVALLCAGIQLAFFSGRPYSPRPDQVQCLVPAAGAIASLWIWRRFGFYYAFLAAMIFVVFLPGYWTESRTAQHIAIVAIFAVVLAILSATRSRHCFDYLKETYSFGEASLWLGMYLTINLQLPLSRLSTLWWRGNWEAVGFPRSFYWGTWVVIWCLPPIILVSGIRLKDRFVIAVGGVTAILTLITNKPYLGWPRHTWDPIFLGLLLTGAAIAIQRWLAAGPGGIRHGFTAARLTKRDKDLVNVGSAGLGLLSPQSAVPASGNSEFRFGGGQTGGGGAGGTY